MSDITLTALHARWRWRRDNAPRAIDKMMDLAPGTHPSGTFTDTLLHFKEQSLEVPPQAAPLFPQGVPGPARGTWYRGTVETNDKYHNLLDNDAALGTFWAKLWAPTPTRIAKVAILLLQYNFTVPGLPHEEEPTGAFGVRIFAGNLWENRSEGLTFYGAGFDNWNGHTHYTFTLTQEPWPQS